MHNYLCRLAELNSSSPVLPEGAHSLERNIALSCQKTLRGRGGGEGGGEERKRQMERRERGRKTNRERVRERVSE